MASEGLFIVYCRREGKGGTIILLCNRTDTEDSLEVSSNRWGQLWVQYWILEWGLDDDDDDDSGGGDGDGGDDGDGGNFQGSFCLH